MPDTRTRILLVNDHLGWDGQVHGVARLFRLWATHLDSEKYDVSVCILNKKSGLASILEECGVRTIFLGKAKYDPTALLGLVRLINREKIDILHVQGYRGETFGRLAGLITGVPVLLHFHDTNPSYPWIQRLSNGLLRGSAAAYLAVSNQARDLWARRGRLDRDGIVVMHNCTSLEEFRPPDAADLEAERERLGIEPDLKIVGAVARLFETKGIRYLLQAVPCVLEAFPDTIFVVVGDGPLKPELVSLTAELGVQQNVRFVGYVENVARALGTFDIKVLPSIHEGGSPLPVLEAMSMGKPIIVTDTVEVIQDGFSGIVVPPGDPRALADKIAYLLGNEEEAKRLGANARARSTEYDVAHYVSRLGQIYDSLLLDNSKRRLGLRRGA